MYARNNFPVRKDCQILDVAPDVHRKTLELVRSFPVCALGKKYTIRIESKTLGPGERESSSKLLVCSASLNSFVRVQKGIA